MYSLLYNQTELSFRTVTMLYALCIYALCIFGKFILLCKHSLAKFMVEFPSQYTYMEPSNGNFSLSK